MAKIIRKPWYEVILDMMEEKIPRILVSNQAEQEMYELGDIFKKALLPEDAKTRRKISKRIESLAFDPRIPDEGDTKRAYIYLWELYSDLIVQ